jgi:hypothetical protein
VVEKAELAIIFIAVSVTFSLIGKLKSPPGLNQCAAVVNRRNKWRLISTERGERVDIHLRDYLSVTDEHK